MKKSYITPATQVFKLQTPYIIAASIGMSSEGANPNYPGGGDVKEELIFGEEENIWGKGW